MLFFTGRYYLCRQYSSYTQWSSGDASSTCLSWIWVCKTSWYVVLSMLHSMFGCNFMQWKFKYFIGYISSDRSFYTLNISREGLLVTLDLNGVKFEVMGCRWLNLTTWAKTRVVVEYSQWQFVYFFSVPSAYPASLSGLEFASYATRPGTIFDYGLETSILGESDLTSLLTSLTQWPTKEYRLEVSQKNEIRNINCKCIINRKSKGSLDTKVLPMVHNVSFDIENKWSTLITVKLVMFSSIFRCS